MNNTVEEAIGGYVAEENKVAASSVVELPTRDEVVEAADGAVWQYISANCGRIPDAEETVRLTIASLIARGWLKVRES